jgi:ribosomal protein S18 acetylase RimI-like enzyme
MGRPRRHAEGAVTATAAGTSLPGIRIREATAADDDAVVALWDATGLIIPANDPHADIALCRTSPGSTILLAEDDIGALIGTVMAGSDGHRGWLYYLATDPQRQQHGIGRALVREAEAWLAGRGIAKVQLMIRNTNALVQAFYERIGYATEPRIVMSRRLRG